MNYAAATGEFSPGMAESFTSDDGVTWTLKLREGVQFSDGTPFDAAAVVFNWDRAKDPAKLSPGGSAARAMSYEAVDPTTVRITLPWPNWLMSWALYIELAFIGSPTAIQQKGVDFANSPVGAGPFVFANWARGTRLELIRNPTYWDQPRPYADAIAFAPIGADDQRLNALRAGNITVMSTLTDEYAEWATREGLHRSRHVQLRWGRDPCQLEAGPAGGRGCTVGDRQARRRQADQRRGLPGRAGAGHLRAAGHALLRTPSGLSRAGLAGAQALIDRYRARNGGGEVVVTYKLVGAIPLQDQVAQLFQAQVQRVNGLKLEIVPLDISAFVGDLNTGNDQLILNGFNGVAIDSLYELFHTGASQNGGGYSDPATDAALERARGSKDPEQQLAAYKEAMVHIAANVGHRSWRYQTTHLLAADTVHGVQPNFNYFMRSDLVWLER